jgi:hypothetical protein
LERQKKLSPGDKDLIWDAEISGDETDIEEGALQELAGHSPAPRQRHKHYSTDSKTAKQAFESEGRSV